MGLTLYNTLHHKMQEFKPLKPGKVGLYTCGPTVYNYLHVGNYRTYVFEDVLRRTLEYLGYTVRHVMNITDVGHLTSQADEGEDKVELEAAKEGKSAWDIAKFYTQSFLDDSAKLNLLPPHVLCRATEHIPEQTQLVDRLKAKNLTYEISDGIYFDTSRFPDYGQLMGLKHHLASKPGARVEVNPEKLHPTDFALWKFSPKDKKRQMEWKYQNRMGFPGWHIECSAMAMKYLGESFDIHCGGVDHIPIHHTNEIAQAEGATGKPFVKFWMHGEFLVMNKAKMAKSAGGFIRLKDIEDKGFDALDYRYFCFSAHYRKQLEFSWEALEAAKNARLRLRGRVLDLLSGSPSGADEGKIGCAEFDARLSDDLDMPGALAAVWAMFSQKGSAKAILGALRRADSVLGLGLLQGSGERLPADLEALFDRYVSARRNKDFKASDALRKELAAKGVKVEDTPSGSKWKRL